MLICKNCGKELDDAAIFCTGCGKELNAPEFPGAVEEAGQSAASDVVKTESVEDTIDAAISALGADEGASVNNESPATNDTQTSESIFESESGILQDEKNVTVNDNDDTINISDAAETHAYGAGSGNQPAEYQPTGYQSRPQSGQYQGGYSQQPYGYGQPAMQTAPSPVKEKKEVKVGAGRVIGASVVAFFAIVFTLLLSLILCVKFGANGNIIRGRVEKLDLRTILTAEYDGEEISTDLYKTIGFRTATEGTADESSFKEFMLKSDFLEYAGERAESYVNYIADGKGSDPSVTSEDFVNDFFKENRSAAKETFNYDMTEESYKTIRSNLDKEDFDTTMSVREWGDKAGFGLKNLSYVFSYITIGIIFALIIVLFIWILVIVDKKGRHLTGFYGNILFISGVIVFAVGVAIIVGAPVAYAFTNELAFYIIANVLLPFALVALCTGFVELLIGGILKKVKKSIKRKEKRNAVSVNA